MGACQPLDQFRSSLTLGFARADRTADLREVVGVRGFPPESLRSGQGDDGRNDASVAVGLTRRN